MMQARQGKQFLIMSLILPMSLVVGLSQHARADAAQYTYDAAGRLSGVIDPINGSASYTYDSVGNIISVIRNPVTALVILQTTPPSAIAGSSVTIAGTGFGTTANTSVTFNGARAMPTAVTPTSMTVTVPASATTGPLVVTAPSGSATYGSLFTVISATPPAITGFSPAIADIGASVSISGTGFDPLAANNKITINGRYSEPTSVTTASIIATLPVIATGHIGVSTPNGTAVTPGFVAVPPAPYKAAQVGAVSTGTVGGAAVTSTLGSDGQVGLIVFDATPGQRVAIQVGSSSFQGGTIMLYGPDGAQIGRSISLATGTFLDTQTLPAGGTYTLLVAPPSMNSAGAVSLNVLSVPQDVITPVTANGAPVSGSNTAIGQNMAFTFGGTAGERVSLLTQANSALYQQGYSITITGPDGVTQVYASVPPTLTDFSGEITLPATGTYTVLINPAGTGIGTATETLYTVPADPIATIAATGAAVSLSTTTPGQVMRLTTNGLAGAKVSLLTQGDTGLSSYFGLVIVEPDGKTPLYTKTNGANPDFTGALTLPLTGTYALDLTPLGTHTGGATFILYTVPANAGGPIQANGSAYTFSTSAPGQNMTLTFAGSAGQQVSLLTQSAALSGAQVVITAPDGQTVVYRRSTGGPTDFSDAIKLPATGTYSIAITPYGQAFGSATFTLYTVPPPASGMIVANGSAVTLSTTQPAQNAQLTFSGSASAKVSLSVLEDTGLSQQSAGLSIVEPDGATTLYQTYFNGGAAFTDALILPVTGTYTVVLNPSYAAIGSATFNLYALASDAAGQIVPGGGSVTLTIAEPGQNGQLSFTGTAGNRISLLTQESASLAQNCALVTITEPDGVTKLDANSFCGGGGPSNIYAIPRAVAYGTTFPITGVVPTLATTGSYSILFNPVGTVTGTATLTLYNLPPDPLTPITIGGSAATLTTTVPGQSARVTFPGAAGQTAVLHVTASNETPTTGCFFVTALQPDGQTILYQGQVCGLTFTSGSIALPTTGVQTVVLSPTGTTIGTFAISVTAQ